MTSHVVKPLTPETFSAWLALAQKHNGVWGGCYCTYFHGDTECTVKSEYDGPMFKQRLVAEASPRPLSSSTATRRSRGASLAAQLNCRAFTTARAQGPCSRKRDSRSSVTSARARP